MARFLDLGHQYQIQLIQLLQENGVMLSIPRPDGLSPIVRLLQNISRSNCFDSVASRYGTPCVQNSERMISWITMCEELIDCGENWPIDSIGEAGDTSLHILASCVVRLEDMGEAGSEAFWKLCSKVCLCFTGDPNSTNHQGDTALHTLMRR